MIPALAGGVGGVAIKGPAATIFRERGLDASAAGIARHHRGLVDCLVIDAVDAGAVARVAVRTHG